MGTRADFYVGRGETAEWLGSVAYDAYPEWNDKPTFPAIFSAATEADFRAAVLAELDGRDDATKIEQGWPWPWETSSTTDYAYAFDEGKVWASGFGGAWFDPLQPKSDTEENSNDKSAIFPNMKDRQNVTFGHRSGMLIVGI